MELSSPKFKSLAVTAGFSFWFFIISTTIGVFSLEAFVVFVAIVIVLTQIFSVKLSKGLDAFAIINTKIFLGILFVFVVSLYGIFLRVLGVDLLRTQRQEKTYWLDTEQLKTEKIFKQY
tara:strand:- start:119 stop:475 length:357 start_codon:yes stop_codon:yes gene_type:complete